MVDLLTMSNGGPRMRRIRRRLTVVIMLGASAVFGATQVFGASPEANPVVRSPDPFAGVVVPSGPELTREQIVSIAEHASTQAGEPNPSISMGHGTLEAAMRTIDPSSQFPESTSPGYRAMFAMPVFLVALHGHFTLTDALVRRGSPMPSGTVLDLVIDAHTGAVTGRALPTLEEQQQGEAAPLARVASRSSFIVVHALRGLIVGHLYLSGGRRGSVVPGNRVAVIVRHGSRTVARAITSRHGAFRVSIKAGSYRVAGTYGGCVANKVVVRAGKTTHTRLICGLL
jgi:hypothetical protein